MESIATKRAEVKAIHKMPSSGRDCAAGPAATLGAVIGFDPKG